MNKGIRFTDEFKRDAVAQVVERGYAVSEGLSGSGLTYQIRANAIRQQFINND